jgi:RNA polymerase sigma-70 factor (ECF subfamily)
MSPPPDEHDAFVREAIRQHERPLLRYVIHLLGDHDRARDVVQDTFVKLCRQPVATVDGHVAEWLFTVARHAALDALRKEGRMSRFAEGQAERLVAAEPTPAAQTENRESCQQALALLPRLPANQQEVVRLKFQEGFSYKEIAAITRLTSGNVGFLLHTALATLRREMTRPSAV